MSHVQILKSMLGIIIITYNNSSLILDQIQGIQKFCKDPYSIVIVDNSTDKDESDAIKYHSREHTYVKVFSNQNNGSESHAFAANFSWNKFKDDFDYFFYLDHDCFPIKEFSVSEILGDNSMGGMGQQKSKLYMWPGCLMFKKMDGIDFSCSHEFGLDTGGGLWKTIESLGVENCVWFDEVYHQNPFFNKSQYNYYSLIGDKFMHFVAASNWPNSPHNQERVNSLLNILRAYYV